MAMSLIEAMKGTNDPIRSGVLEIIGLNNPILAAIPFQDIAGNSYTYLEEGGLPPIGARAINAAFDEGVGTLNPRTETFKLFGGDMDVDRALIQMHPNSSIGDLRATHVAMKTKALALYILKKVFKGSEVVDNREFDGLQRRCVGSQLIYAGATAAGDTLTLAKVDELLDLVDGADALYLNKTLRRKMNVLIRAAGQAQEFVTDQFGRQLQSYAGVPMVTIEEDEAKAEILQFNEAGASAGSACSSIYAAKYGEDEYLSMLQCPPGLEVRDLGELDAKPVFRTRVDWTITLAQFRARAAARLAGITNT